MPWRKSRGSYEDTGWEGEHLGQQGREPFPEEAMFGSEAWGRQRSKTSEDTEEWNQLKGLLSGEGAEPSGSRTDTAWLGALWPRLYSFKDRSACHVGDGLRETQGIERAIERRTPWSGRWKGAAWPTGWPWGLIPEVPISEWAVGDTGYQLSLHEQLHRNQPSPSCSAHLLGRSQAHQGLVSLPPWHMDFFAVSPIGWNIAWFFIYLFICGSGDRGMAGGLIDDLSQTKPNFLCFPEPFIILSACCHFFLELGWPGSAQSQRSEIFSLKKPSYWVWARPPES